MKRILIVCAATMLLSVSFSVQADPPDPTPGATKPVREQSLDGTGWIAVHEQGTAMVEVQGTADVKIVNDEAIDVNVSGGSIDANISGGVVTVDNTSANPVPVEGTVTVDNFPGQQGVWIDGGIASPVTKAYFDRFELDPRGVDTRRHDFGVGPILATLIQVSDSDDETITYFLSHSLASGNSILAIDDRGGDSPDHVISLTYPMEIYGYQTSCHNEDLICKVSITVVGFPVD